MPTYQYQCHRCGLEYEYVRPIVNRHDLISCECGEHCNLKPSLPASRPDMTVAELTWPSGHKTKAEP